MTTATTVRTGTLAVPGATLHHEVRGSGPFLLLVPGGAGDAGMYAGMHAALTARYTVVSYDPRGLSRSPLDGPLTDQRVDVWSDDARRLIEHLSPDGTADVLGCSSGAIVAVDLLARHPDRVRRVVAHEPPLLELLDDPAPHRAFFADVRDTHRTEGIAAAMARFSEGLGGARPADDPGRTAEAVAEEATELPPEIQEMAPRMHANLPVFLDRMLHPFATTPPDLAALRPVADRLVPAAGRDSRHQLPLYGPASRLAALLHRELAEFPGGHLGAVEQPTAFARRLLALLAPAD
ncbi:alpha/beta fold hydrolase [Streptomyces sp. NRRL B-24484]|uniref:alpha/beta fold hydrolase n=1 Tax=Streptomyces sp. NRRL B-24484 TaxID=1463833 RepID=UPI0004C27992|nr:alpha/beta hydrolase [Streptomyces sp. NRRL B-24484]